MAGFLRFATITVLSAFFLSAQHDAVGQDMQAKVLVGYQGWFRCPGDGSPHNSWSHWSRGVPSPETLSIDLYPDVNELSGHSLCALPNMTIDGKQAYVFSSFEKETVEKHFEWMKTYGIDGALLQRFVGEIAPLHAEGDVVLRNVMASAQDHDRVFAVEYDLSGSHPATVLQQLQNDWTYLTNTVGVTASPAYLKLDGKPVVSLWGLGFAGEGNHVVDQTTTRMRRVPSRRRARSIRSGDRPSRTIGDTPCKTTRRPRDRPSRARWRWPRAPWRACCPRARRRST